MQTIIVDVTEEDIAGGVANNALCCAVTRAISRQLAPGICEVDTGETYVWISRIGEVGDPYELPPRACQFIADTDAGYLVQPFTFPLEIPDWVSVIPSS